MTASRPYLIRALYEWILDNQCTPYLLVDASVDGVFVPEEFIDDGKIVLNLSPTAVQKLQLANDNISFSARFSSSARQVEVPISAVLAIYARENGQGMMFNEEHGDTPPSGPSHGGPKPGGPPPVKKPQLKVVK